MHELAVTQSLLALAVQHAGLHHAQRVTEIQVVIGQLASIVDDSVQFYWDLISAGTLCEGARLRFERVPARVRCQDCDLTFELAHSFATCPRCQSQQLKVTSGDELQIESICVEIAEPETMGA